MIELRKWNIYREARIDGSGLRRYAGAPKEDPKMRPPEKIRRKQAIYVKTQAEGAQ